MEKILFRQGDETPRTPQENKANDLQAQPKMNSKENLDGCRTCGNCDNYVPYQHRPDIGKCLKGIVHWTTYDIKAHDCPAYEPEQD